MGMKRYPVEIEIVEVEDDGRLRLLATVKAFDEAAAEVSIKEIVDPHQWRELAKQIQSALDEMELTG